MESSQPKVCEVELYRQMLDDASRAHVQGSWQMRHQALQRLMAKIQTLSDQEFETTFLALESLVENFTAKKLAGEKKDRGAAARSNEVAALLERAANQTPKRPT